jgi:CxxC motif-containing protein (DUF1111 family)
VEVDERQLGQLVAFIRMIGPPAPGPGGSGARRGSALFSRIGCASCHRPRFETKAAAPYLSNRTIRPYTDLLLHDMGDGLADGLSREWRTAPLWGAARRRRVQGDEYYLHDGRARSLAEAILWHGGEADRAARAFASLPREDRSALLAFLATL